MGIPFLGIRIQMQQCSEIDEFERVNPQFRWIASLMKLSLPVEKSRRLVDRGLAIQDQLSLEKGHHLALVGLPVVSGIPASQLDPPKTGHSCEIEIVNHGDLLEITNALSPRLTLPCIEVAVELALKVSNLYAF